MGKIIVVAGTREQSMNWIRADYSKRANRGEDVSLGDYIYVSHPNNIRGFRNPTGVFVGTWRSLPNIKEIIDILQICSNFQNKTLIKLRDEL